MATNIWFRLKLDAALAVLVRPGAYERTWSGLFTLDRVSFTSLVKIDSFGPSPPIRLSISDSCGINGSFSTLRLSGRYHLMPRAL